MPECKDNNEKIPYVFHIVVATAIVKNKTVPLLQRKSNEEVYAGLWEFPHGKRKLKKTSGEALVREVKEETGLSIAIERPIPIFEYVIETPTEVRDTTQINFLARPVEPEETVKINKEEHQAAKWFTKEKAT